jgi:hypothetical protein
VGLASAGLPADGCGAVAAFGLVSAGLTDAALAATGCFSVTFATGVALAAAGGGRFTSAGVGVAAFAGACFTVVGRTGLAEMAAGRRGADAAACEADAPLPFVALPADAFMPDTFNLCPSRTL